MTTMATALNQIANIASASPWDEAAILKSKMSTDQFTLLDLKDHIDNFLVKATKTETCEQRVEKMKLVAFKYISIPMGSYYGDLWYGLKKSDVPMLQAQIASGHNMLITPADLVKLIEIQKKRGYQFVLNLEVNPAVAKHTGVVNVQLRNITVNG